MFFSAVNTQLSYNNANVIDTMSFFVRFIIIPILFFYFKMLFNRNKEYTVFLYKKIFLANILVFLVNFILGLLGYGFASYIVGFGIKGFFHNVHLAAGVLFCFFYYILSKINKANFNYRIVVYILTLFIAILMGTKTAVLSIFLFSIVDLYYNINNKWKALLKFLFPLIMLIMIFVVTRIILTTEFFYHMYTTIITNIYRGNNLIALVDLFLSGRITQVQIWTEYYYNNFSVFNLLFGLGYLVRVDGHGPMEMDFFFVFFFYGIVTLLIILFFYVYLIIMSLKVKNVRLFFFNFIFLLVSFSTGYVWMNVMAGVFFAYINACELASNSEKASLLI